VPGYRLARGDGVLHNAAMAAFDALLQLVVAQGAEALTLVEGEVPELTKAGERTALSMPPLARETLARFAADAHAVAREGRYVLEGRGGVRAEFVVTLAGTGGGASRLEFRLVGGGSQPSQAPRAAEKAATGQAMPSSQATADTASVARLIELAMGADASDLLISSGTDARMKVGRELRPIADSACDVSAILTYFALDERQRDRFAAGRSVDVARDVEGGRIRANLFRHRDGIAVAIRPIRRVRSLGELGLPADLRTLVRFHDGLVLFVGPTGSGKSSTLAALIDHLASMRACHIVTIEDPIEFHYDHGRSMIHQREVGTHVESFAEGLWAALRESPDVILLGEMRDPATIAAALTAAETGHLVLSTLHSGGAAMAIDRIVDSFPPHQQQQIRHQLASVLRAVATQVLLPTTAPGKLVPALEKMIVTHAIAHSIRDARGHQLGSHIQTGREEGMVSLELSLADLVRRRVITTETATGAARDPDLLRKLLAG